MDATFTISIDVTEYEISIDIEIFNRFLQVTLPEYDKAGQEIENSRKLSSKLVKAFQNRKNETEKEHFSLRAKVGRIYNVKKQKTTDYFTGLAFCTQSKQCKCTYNFRMENKPLDTATFFVVKVKRTGTHNHPAYIHTRKIASVGMSMSMHINTHTHTHILEKCEYYTHIHTHIMKIF